MTAEFRLARPADWPEIVRLNNAEVPKVGRLVDAVGEGFLTPGTVVVLDAPADASPGLIALLILLTDGSEYRSPNYAWFAARYQRFAYVDRIVVRADQAGTGIGRALYDHAVSWARTHDRPVLTAEVNLDPPNHGSLAFHRRYGFVEVGQQIDPRNRQLEAMFALDISGRHAEAGRYTSTSDFPVQRPEPLP